MDSRYCFESAADPCFWGYAHITLFAEIWDQLPEFFDLCTVHYCKHLLHRVSGKIQNVLFGSFFFSDVRRHNCHALLSFRQSRNRAIGRKGRTIQYRNARGFLRDRIAFRFSDKHLDLEALRKKVRINNRGAVL